MLVTLFLLTAASLALSLLFTPIVRILAVHWGLVDVPDNKRKVHKQPIPRIGGVAVAIAYFGSCLLVAGFSSLTHLGDGSGFTAARSIAPAVVLIFLVGLADDIFNLKPAHKFAVQILAAVMVVSGGNHIHNIGAFPLHPALGMVATVIWLVACTNAVNLIDGLDGLAGGVALLATMTTLIAAVIGGNVELIFMAAPLAGALIGFLVFNFNPASIFLGDSGSLVLGFLLGCFSILWTGKSATVVGTLAPLMALSVPLMDTSLAIARRFLRGQPIFRPDRSHIHHRLLARGLTQRRAVLSLYMAAGIAGALSLCLAQSRSHWVGVIVTLFVCGAMYGIRQLSYTEFDTVRRIITQGGLRREIKAQFALQSFEETLERAQTADDCWAVVQEAAGEFGFQPMRMQFAGRVFRRQPAQYESKSWAMRIPISEDDWVELSHDCGPAGHPTALVLFAHTMRKVLADKSITVAHIDEQAAVFSTAIYATVTSTAQWSSEQAY